ncbi:hypothetical protein FRC03_003080 [Tulasnella sp. 419]|nr:hypothetical protein FRC03_003080 [Tulasnella sp. 419]
MHSISDLTTFARKTKGHVPPQLVGASTTVVGNKMYLFGGRLVSARRMVSDLYVFNMDSFVWEKIEPTPEEDIPGARYFHSADAWNNRLIVFGGMGYTSANPDELCVLNDVRFFDLTSRKWIPSTPQDLDNTIPPNTPSLVPRARYAHLSSITSDRLFIIGGQDMSNVWLDDIHVFDLVRGAWIQKREYPRHCGTYRSVAVSALSRVRLPQEELTSTAGSAASGLLGPPGSRFKGDNVPPASPSRVISDELIHLSYSANPTLEYPNDILLYSNYNFTDVRRELEVITPKENDFEIMDRSDSMSGVSLPPGLRFPTGAILGSHLIIAGTYLAHSYQSFSIWALDLVSMAWSRIDAGSTLGAGSWSRGVLWAEANKFLIFGNRAGNLVEDYNRRLLSWDHVACIDLEAFGIYQPPRLVLNIEGQELGLAALEEGVLADFELVCDDGRKIKCSRSALERRWPWFKKQREIYLAAAQKALETLPSSATDLPLPEIAPIRPLSGTPPDAESAQAVAESRPDPRLTPRSFHLSEPYAVTLAFLQYIYSTALITPLQHAPPVLSSLLLLSTTYELPHLESLVKHAMHKALSPSSSVGVYEVATLCDCQSLQIRALKVVMSSSRRPAQQQITRRNDRNDGADDMHHGQGHHQASRPRGMSDAPRPRETNGSGGYGGDGYTSSASRIGGGDALQASPFPAKHIFRPDYSVSSGYQRRPSVPEVSPLRSPIKVNTSAPGPRFITGAESSPVTDSRRPSLPEGAKEDGLIAKSMQKILSALEHDNTVLGDVVRPGTNSARNSLSPQRRVAPSERDGPFPRDEFHGHVDKIVRRWSRRLVRSSESIDSWSTTSKSPMGSRAPSDDGHDAGDTDNERLMSSPILVASPVRITSLRGQPFVVPTSAATSGVNHFNPATPFQPPYHFRPGPKRMPSEASTLSSASSFSGPQTPHTPVSASARRRAGSDATNSFDGPRTPPNAMPLSSLSATVSQEFGGLHRIDEFASVHGSGSKPTTPRSLNSMASMPDLRKQMRSPGEPGSGPRSPLSGAPPEYTDASFASSVRERLESASVRVHVVDSIIDESRQGSSSYAMDDHMLSPGSPNYADSDSTASIKQSSALSSLSVPATISAKSGNLSDSASNGAMYPIPTWHKMDKEAIRAKLKAQKAEKKAKEQEAKEALKAQLAWAKEQRKRLKESKKTETSTERGRVVNVLHMIA